MKKKGRQRSGDPRKKKLVFMVRCDECGKVQRNTKAHPPPEFPLPTPPLLAASRFEQQTDWVATCRRCPSVTGVFVAVAA